MKHPQKREQKKKSTKPYYCEFEGKVIDLQPNEKPPKIIECPSCKRRLKPSMWTCTGHRDCYCCGQIQLKKHRRKNK